MSDVAPLYDPNDFHQLKLLFSDPLQHDYEVIRPIVLFAEHIGERSQHTGIDRTTISTKARRFVEQGMTGLGDQRRSNTGRKPHRFPDTVASYILYLKQIYPPIRYREIVRIIKRKYGYHTNHHTVKRFLAQHPLPVQLPLEWTTFHQFEDAYRARWTVVRMCYEGWHQQSIAGCLQLSRQHVRNIVDAFERDGFAGLEDQRQRPATHPANQLTLPLMHDILALQHAYPRAGRFRIRGLLGQHMDDPPSLATVGRAMALNRAFHGAPGAWSSDTSGTSYAGDVHDLPYQPLRRHQYWFIDLRYLRKLDGSWVYAICVLEGYSRKMLAGMVSPQQDLIAILQILTAALTEYGCPHTIVSDNGAVFTAHAYQDLLEHLGIHAAYIAKGKPWQNLLEAQFKVQVRLGQVNFDRATTLADLQTAHAHFIETFNTTDHWAHRERHDGLHTPLDVLGWVQGRTLDVAQLHAVLRHVHYERTADRHGYISIQRFYIYAERGVARQRVSVWLYEGRLHIEYQQTMLTRYAYRYHRKHQRIQTITNPQRQTTWYTDPQLELWELDDAQWRKVLERPIRPRRPRQRPDPQVEQLALRLVGMLLVCLA